MKIFLACITFILAFLFGVGGSFINDHKSDVQKLGPDAAASIVIYFKRGINDEQIRNFIDDEVMEKDLDGRGRAHKPGIVMFYRLLPAQANNYEAAALTFTDGATEEQRLKIVHSIEADEIVYKVFKNVAPNEIKIERNP